MSCALYRTTYLFSYLGHLNVIRGFESWICIVASRLTTARLESGEILYIFIFTRIKWSSVKVQIPENYPFYLNSAYIQRYDVNIIYTYNCIRLSYVFIYYDLRILYIWCIQFSHFYSNRLSLTYVSVSLDRETEREEI